MTHILAHALEPYAIAFVSSWLTSGVIASFSEPDIWRDHRFHRPTPVWGLLIVALGPTLLIFNAIPWFAMRNLRDYDGSGASAQIDGSGDRA